MSIFRDPVCLALSHNNKFYNQLNVIKGKSISSNKTLLSNAYNSQSEWQLSRSHSINSRTHSPIFKEFINTILCIQSCDSSNKCPTTCLPWKEHERELAIWMRTFNRWALFCCCKSQFMIQFRLCTEQNGILNSAFLIILNAVKAKKIHTHLVSFHLI